MKIEKNADVIKSTPEELLILDRLGEEYKRFSEMSDQDRAFLNSLVLRKQPKKLLEVGVSKGGSSLIILNAIKEFPDAHLYSCDYNENCYRVPDKKTGFYVDNFPELKEKWSLYTGGLTLNFLDEIGTDIDFCLIDTVHSNPGEILDFIMVLPYLSKDAIVVFHDTSLYIDAFLAGRNGKSEAYTNALLMSAISGEKLIPAADPYRSYDFELDYLPNIGAVKVNEATYKNIFGIFNLLGLHWTYMPAEQDLTQFADFIKRFYDDFYVNFFEDILKWQRLAEKGFDKYLRERSKSHCYKHKYTFWERVFSIRNEKQRNKDYYHKVICIFGIKIKFRIDK